LPDGFDEFGSGGLPEQVDALFGSDSDPFDLFPTTGESEILRLEAQDVDVFAGDYETEEPFGFDTGPDDMPRGPTFAATDLVDDAAAELPSPPPPPEEVGEIADIFEFYEDQLKSPRCGLVYAIACSHDSVKNMFVPRLLDFVLSGAVPPSLCVLFLGECSQFCGDYQERCFSIIYGCLAIDRNEFVATAIREMALNSRGVFLDQPDLLLSRF
jgi:hypothetical protein